MTSSSDPAVRPLERLRHSVLPAVLIYITVVRAHFAPGVLLLLVIRQLFFARLDGGLRQLPGIFGAPDRWVLVFCLFATLSAIWSLDPLHSLQVGIQILAICLGPSLTLWLIHRSPAAHMEGQQYGVLCGFALGAGMIAFELLAGFPITKTIVEAFPDLTENIKGTVYVGYVEGVLIAYPGFFTRSNFVLAVLAWPVLYLAWVTTTGPLRIAYIAATLVLLGCDIAVLEKATAQIALAISILVFASSLKFPRLSYNLLVAAWIGLVVLAVPLAIFASQLPPDVSGRLSSSADARLKIWGQIAPAVAERPLLGIGADATRPAGKARVARMSEGDVAKQSEKRFWAVRHPHNSFLQVWFELGALGAGLLLAAGVAVLRATRKLVRNSWPFANATVAVAIFYASLAHSIWQPWFAATLTLAVVIFGIAGAWTKTRPPIPAK